MIRVYRIVPDSVVAGGSDRSLSALASLPACSQQSFSLKSYSIGDFAVSVHTPWTECCPYVPRDFPALPSHLGARQGLTSAPAMSAGEERSYHGQS